MAEAAEPLDLQGFLDLLPELSPAELLAVSASYRAADPDRRLAARDAAMLCARLCNCEGELTELEGSIIQWANSSFARTATIAGVRSDLVLTDIRVQAIEPLVDAAIALLLSDALSEGDRTVLLEPVQAAIG